MEENAILIEQYADSPASLNHSFHYSFFFIILIENRSSMLLAFRSMFAGTISIGSSNSSAKFTDAKKSPENPLNPSRLHWYFPQRAET